MRSQSASLIGISRPRVGKPPGLFWRREPLRNHGVILVLSLDLMSHWSFSHYLKGKVKVGFQRLQSFERFDVYTVFASTTLKPILVKPYSCLAYCIESSKCLTLMYPLLWHGNDRENKIQHQITICLQHSRLVTSEVYSLLGSSSVDYRPWPNCF